MPDLQGCIELLQRGQVVAIPTDTIYGLAVPANNSEAIERLFQMKHRPQNKPMVIQICSIEQLNDFGAVLSPSAKALSQVFWPGALSLILEIDEDLVAASIRANLSTAAFRIPDHKVTLEILKKIGPLVVTSANLSSQTSTQTPEEIRQVFGQDFPIFEDGLCAGAPSTLLAYKKDRWVMLREGALEAQRFEAILDYSPAAFF